MYAETYRGSIHKAFSRKTKGDRSVLAFSAVNSMKNRAEDIRSYQNTSETSREGVSVMAFHITIEVFVG
jgi:hypothetical protein